MQSNVNTKELNGIALEIAKNIESLHTNIGNYRDTATSIINQCEILDGYNGQRVAGSTIIDEKYDENGEYNKTIETYKIWRIEGQSELESNCSNLESQLENIEETLTNLKLETSDMELIADAIEGYIETIQEELGEDIDPSVLASAFGTLSTGIAFDSYSASTGNFISPEHILTEYWTDKALRFEKNSDGTYTIYQKDNNGNEIAMGYTTALTAALYMKKIKDLTTNNGSTAGDNSSVSSGSSSNNGYGDSSSGSSSNNGYSDSSSGSSSNNGYGDSSSGSSSNNGYSDSSSGSSSNNGYGHSSSRSYSNGSISNAS